MQGSQSETPVVSAIGLRAYARSRKERGLQGGSLRAVQKAIEDGRVTAWGWIPAAKGGKPSRKITDPAAADRQWEESTSASQIARQAAAAAVAGPTVAAPASPVVPTEASTQPPASAPEDKERAEFLDRRKTILDHQSRLKAAQAELKEIEAAQRRGELVSRSQIERQYETAARMIRDQLLSLGADLGRRVAFQFSLDEARAVATCKTVITEFLLSLSNELAEKGKSEDEAAA